MDYEYDRECGARVSYRISVIILKAADKVTVSVCARSPSGCLSHLEVNSEKDNTYERGKDGYVMLLLELY